MDVLKVIDGDCLVGKSHNRLSRCWATVSCNLVTLELVTNLILNVREVDVDGVVLAPGPRLAVLGVARGGGGQGGGGVARGGGRQGRGEGVGGRQRHRVPRGARHVRGRGHVAQVEEVSLRLQEVDVPPGLHIVQAVPSHQRLTRGSSNVLQNLSLYICFFTMQKVLTVLDVCFLSGFKIN